MELSRRGRSADADIARQVGLGGGWHVEGVIVRTGERVVGIQGRAKAGG